MSKVREEFEAWAKERFGWPDGRFEMYLGEYVNGKTFDKWKVWQASRQALVVELPKVDKIEFGDEFTNGSEIGQEIAIDAVSDILKKAGIKCK